MYYYYYIIHFFLRPHRAYRYRNTASVSGVVKFQLAVFQTRFLEITDLKFSLIITKFRLEGEKQLKRLNRLLVYTIISIVRDLYNTYIYIIQIGNVLGWILFWIPKLIERFVTLNNAFILRKVNMSVCVCVHCLVNTNPRIAYHIISTFK